MTGATWRSTSAEYLTPGGAGSSAWGFDRPVGGSAGGGDGGTWGAENGWGAPGLVDSEALIAVEICLVKGEPGSEDLRIANILFNNLDVIGEIFYMASMSWNN